MKTTIYAFSGTGNTEIVAQWLGESLQAQGAEVTLTRIEDVLKGKVSLSKADLIGIAHPIYGFDAPGIVDAFVDRLPPGGDRRTFVLKTAGGPSPSNDAASQTIIRRLERKGYVVFYDRLIAMPSNWAYTYPEALNRQLVRAAVLKTQHMAGEILSNQRRRARVGPLFHAAMRQIHLSEELGGRVFGRLLHTTNDCIRCAKCVKNCPVDNIYQQGDQIRFRWRCLWCMRCIYACPRQAIVPRLGKFCALKNGYDIHRVIQQAQSASDDTVTANLTGEFKAYLENIDA
ncbi:MAG: EFR1 family ferrodoxin [Anaerolineae bacterium]|nr:EFR1 family ferrodoxin [Anaerolineae bacterium]